MIWFLSLIAALTLGASSDYARPATAHFQILMDGKRLGRLVVSRRPVTGGFEFTQTEELAFRIEGRTTTMKTLYRCRTDHKLAVRDFYFSLHSNRKQTQIVRGRVRGGRLTVEYVLGPRGARRTKEYGLKGPLAVAPMVTSWLMRVWNQGDRRVKGQVFEPAMMTMSTFTGVMKPLKGREIMAVVRRRNSTFKFWIGSDGLGTRTEAPMNQVLIRRPASEVGPVAGGIDIRRKTAVELKGPIPPWDLRLRRLKLRLTGQGWRRLPLNGPRQRLKGDVLTITRESLADIGDYPLPSRVQVRYLAPTTYVQSNHPRIKAAARRIAGKKNSARTAVRRLWRWVYDRLQKRPVAHAPDAVSVLKTMAGDCNEHAALFVALARAAGVPARVCVGLVLGGSKMYYHAWAMVWLGKWTSVDPTLDQFPAGAGHLRLQYGLSSGMVEMEGVIGRLGLAVLDWK